MQVEESHYTTGYDSPQRYLSYQHQIETVLALKPQNHMEIGIGIGLVPWVLRRHGVQVTQVDIDPALKPDFVSDIRSLPFPDHSFDTIAACEVSEHLPWDQFDEIIKELHRVSRSHVILSLPHPGTWIDIIVRYPGARVFLNRKPYSRISLTLPWKSTKINDREHYWEIGLRGVNLKAVRTKLLRYFHIEAESRPLLNRYHHFFHLRKRYTLEM